MSFTISSLAERAPALPPSSGVDTSGAQMFGREPVRELGQQQFFELLAAQYSYQDPLNPQSDTDFIAQMAQFSALESNRAMQSELEAIRQQSSLAQTTALVGKTVTLQPPNGGEAVQGVVSAVRFTDGGSTVTVNGVEYDSTRVTAVETGYTPVAPLDTPLPTDFRTGPPVIRNPGHAG
jgi:flagellar basal-body rod modification protein FlgD